MVTITSFGGKQIKAITDINELKNIMDDVSDVFDNFTCLKDVITFLSGKFQTSSNGQVKINQSPERHYAFIHGRPNGQYIDMDGCCIINLYDNFTPKMINEIAEYFYDDEPGYDAMLIIDENNKVWFMQCDVD